jgi:peptidoglycan/LPS O-acetylase OafA/YrhL
VDPPASGGSPSAAPVGVRRSTTYFLEVESLRGVAILMVFFYHAAARVGLSGPSPPTGNVSLAAAFILGGNAGVDLFFVLSGFLLSLPFLAAAAGGRRVDRWHYGLRRALRILPLYYTAVLVAAIRWYSPAAGPWRDVPFLFFAQAGNEWVTNNAYSGAWWSLATEAQFYLVLPLLGALRSRGTRLVAAGALAVYALAYLAFLHGRIAMQTVSGSFYLASSLFGRGPFFLWGILAAWLHRRYGAYLRERLADSVVARGGGADGLLLVVLVALAVVLRWNALAGPVGLGLGVLGLWYPAEGALWAGALLLLLVAPLRGKVLLSNPALCFVGVRSYSLYLVHVPLLFELVPRLQRAYPFFGVPGRARVAVALLFVASLLVACLTYALIERPFLRLKGQLDRPQSGSAARRARPRRSPR